MTSVVIITTVLGQVKRKLLIQNCDLSWMHVFRQISLFWYLRGGRIGGAWCRVPDDQCRWQRGDQSTRHVT